MSIAQKDYMLRMIEQFAQALARIIGLKKDGKLDEALQSIRDTADGIFGPLRSMLDQLEPAGAATLLGTAEKIEVYAALTAEEADIAELRGQTRKASAGRKRALELYLAASRIRPPSATVLDAINSLSHAVDDHRRERR